MYVSHITISLRRPRGKSTHLWSLIYDKEGKNIHGEKINLFNKQRWDNWIATHKRMKLEYYLTLYTKSNFKWIKDLNVRPHTHYKTLKYKHR